MKMVPADFEKVTVCNGYGMKRIELGEFIVSILNRHIETNQPFDQPFQYEYGYSDVAPEWIKNHGENKYTLTEKALELLVRTFGKE